MFVENIMMTHYMEPKIADLYFAKHVSEIVLDNKGHIPNHISNVINWSAPEMMQNNALYTQEREIFRRYSLQPSNSISDYKRHSLQLKSKGNLAPNLESVEEYTSYALKSPADFDSFMINQETWEVEKTKYREKVYDLMGRDEDANVDLAKLVDIARNNKFALRYREKPII
ncbi:hypothetical protein C2G38_2136650 [Gigaspora rosea]|uniref:Uncharacterized protein n=1 Tax=Gigaspora rosea TaxID=44941 RepID=A0A397W567_9GLOM|nr:hypothetical protein C2G38_2136650 [Gigaspora rosea]